MELKCIYIFLHLTKALIASVSNKSNKNFSFFFFFLFFSRESCIGVRVVEVVYAFEVPFDHGFVCDLFQNVLLSDAGQVKDFLDLFLGQLPESLGPKRKTWHVVFAYSVVFHEAPSLFE